MSVIVVGIAGIIGVGKSTTLKRLQSNNMLQEEIAKRKKNFGQVVKIGWMLEPSDLWRERGWLEAFYADPVRNALAFQFGVFDTHVDKVEQHVANVNPGEVLILLVERTMYCQRLFWDLQVDMKRTMKMENEVYQGIWNKWRRFVPEPKLIFVLKTSTLEIAMNRVKYRARKGETPLHKKKSVERKELKVSWSEGEDDLGTKEVAKESNNGGVTPEYQKLLLQKHEQWYKEPRGFPPGAPKEGIRCVHVITDQPFHEDDNALQELAATLAAHLVSLLK